MRPRTSRASRSRSTAVCTLSERATSAAGQGFVLSAAAPWERVGDGVRRQILGHGDDLMMVTVEFEAGAIGALHSHSHRQVTYVVRGQFETTIDGERKVLEAGDCF